MIRRRKLAGPMVMNLDDGDLLRTQPLIPKETIDHNKTTLKQTISSNKKFLENILKYTNPNIKLPDSFNSHKVEEQLRNLNVKLTSIASSKEILADYQKHFGALHIFFEKIMREGKQFSQEQVVIWRTFFLNNMAVIAFNNGDYTTSMDILKQIMQTHLKKEIKQPVFSLVITNLSAIYHKMKSWEQSFNYLEKAFQFSKKLMDSSHLTPGSQKSHQVSINSILAIQCIMMIKKKNAIQKSNHNPKQIQKLMIKLVKEANKLSNVDTLEIPYIDKYLEERRLTTDTKDVQSSRTGSKAASIRSRRKHYPLQTISRDTTRDYGVVANESRSDNIQLQLSSPAKRYYLNQMKQQMDQLSSKVNKIQIQQEHILTYLKQIIQIHKNKNLHPPQQTSNKEGLIINKLDCVLDKSQLASKVIFKTLQVQIWFTEQGIKLKTFTKLEENLSWGELQNIFKLFQLFHLYHPYLELSPTRHSIAWVLSKYLTVSNRIKIKRLPWPILTFLHQNQKYGLYHIRQREFSVNGPDFSALVFEMCQKSFGYYFNTYKIDQYQAQCLSFFSKQELKKKKQQYFLQVIRLKEQVRGSTVETNGAFKIDFSQDFHDVFSNLKLILKETNNKPFTYKRVKLWFDETASDSNNFLGVFYLIYQNNDEKQLQFRLYPLNNYEGVNILDPIVKILSFSQIQNRYTFSFNECSPITLNNLFKNLMDTIALRTQAIKRDGKTKYIVHNVVQNTQCIYFQQRMLLKKYYRPLFIYVLRTKSRFLGIRFSCYNEFKIVTYNITVVINMCINKKQEQKHDEMEAKFRKIKQRVKSSFISKIFNQMETTMEQQKIMHLEEFVSMIQAEADS